MEYVLNQLINGICQGAIYALMAIGYSTIVGVVGMVTFTYGEIMMIGAYGAFYIFLTCGNNILLGLLMSFACSFVLGIAVYKLCYERFFNAPRHISLLCTIGFSMLIKNLAQIVFGPETKSMLNIIPNRIFTLHLGSIAVDFRLLQIVILLLVVFLALLLTFFFTRTRAGIALRAASQNKDAAYLVGINVRRYITFPSYTFGSFSMKAFSASVLGGLVDLRMSALGGLCLGIIENLGITISSATFRDVFAFGFLILMLIIRPQGFAVKKGTRV